MTDELLRVDPRFAPEHAAYYLGGLLEYTGSQELPFSLEGFPSGYDDNKPLAFTLRRGTEHRNIYIAADDMATMDEQALEWADVYGKVNLLSELVPASQQHKVVPIGPSHAVRLWRPAQSLRIARRTARAGGRTGGLKAHYRPFWLQTNRRVDESFYQPAPSEDGYVFYNAWLWAKHADANPPRAAFMRACRELSPLIEFEGGFIPRRRNDVPEFDDVIADRRYDLPAYLTNIKRSTLVFNNPAAHACHGWKLAEFLRLGKAIVSLPLSRELPAPLVHGRHLHIVDGSVAAIQEAVRTIVNDPGYRHQLEQAARDYYLEYLAPAQVIARLATIAFGRVSSSPP
jgi:hypothetical protein